MELGEKSTSYQTFFIISLLVFCLFLTYYFHFILKTGIIFTHFFYIPIILAAIWWKRKGLVVPVFLALILIISDILNPLKPEALLEDVFRMIIFISVGIITVILSERIANYLNKVEVSEEKYKLVLEFALEAIITLDSKGNIVSWNREARKIFGYDEDEVLGHPVTLLMPKRFTEKFKESMKTYSDDNSSHFSMSKPDFRGLRKDGTEFPFAASGSSWKSDGEIFFTSVIKDLTDEIKAKETRSILSSLVENSNDSIIAYDLNGSVLSWNQGAEDLYGYNADEMIGHSMSLMFPPGSEELTSILNSIRKGEDIKNHHTQRITKKGDIMDVALTVSPIKDAYGSIVGASSITRDITIEVKARTALKESEAQLSLVTNNMADIICQVDTDGSYIYVSPSMETVLGYPPSFMKGKPMFDFIHPDDQDKVNSCMHSAMEECTAKTAQYRYRSSQGDYIWVETRGNPLIDDGHLNGFVCNTRDITLQKKVEKALQESEKHYRFLIESARDPISIIDQDGIFLMANTAGAEMMNITVDQIVGKSLWELFPESADLQMELIKEVIRERKGFDIELPITYEKDKFWFSTSLQPLVENDGSIKSVQIISRDITELKNVQKELEQALEDKDMLMKEIYHRVKNNLMVISSLLNLQSRYIKDDEARGLFKESQNRARSMALIHERLYRSNDLKRIDFGDYIRTISRDLLHTYDSGASHIKLEIDVEEVLLDINTSIPLGLIVNELISNSLKHAFPNDLDGTIKIGFHEENDKYILEVADDGIGIPDDLDLQQTGSLGMQLVYNLTDQIKADIELKRSKGTKFTITFIEEKY